MNGRKRSARSHISADVRVVDALYYAAAADRSIRVAALSPVTLQFKYFDEAAVLAFANLEHGSALHVAIRPRQSHVVFLRLLQTSAARRCRT